MAQPSGGWGLRGSARGSPARGCGAPEQRDGIPQSFSCSAWPFCVWQKLPRALRWPRKNFHGQLGPFLCRLLSANCSPAFLLLSSLSANIVLSCWRPARKRGKFHSSHPGSQISVRIFSSSIKILLSFERRVWPYSYMTFLYMLLNSTYCVLFVGWI